VISLKDQICVFLSPWSWFSKLEMGHHTHPTQVCSLLLLHHAMEPWVMRQMSVSGQSDMFKLLFVFPRFISRMICMINLLTWSCSWWASHFVPRYRLENHSSINHATPLGEPYPKPYPAASPEGVLSTCWSSLFVGQVFIGIVMASDLVMVSCSTYCMLYVLAATPHITYKYR